MIMYHGTTDKAAEAIKRDGLVPHRASAFQMWRMATDPFFGIETGEKIRLRSLTSERKPLIYLTGDKAIAERFAKFRVRYLATPKGGKVSWNPDPTEYEDSIWFKGKSKLAVVDTDAKPVIVAVEVPHELQHELKPDPQMRGDAKVCECVIQPEMIKEVIQLEA